MELKYSHGQQLLKEHIGSIRYEKIEESSKCTEDIG